MRKVAFTKASACGNDFLIVENESVPAQLDRSGLTVAMCDRYNGVGADGVEWVMRSGADAEVNADLINSDGSPAEISGNGTRCVAAWYAAQGLGEPVVRVRTGAGVKQCRLLATTGTRYDFEMEMGRAQHIEDAKIAGQSGVKIDFGNPHFVLFVGSFNFDWQDLARRLQADSGAFPHGTNVEFVRVIDLHHAEAKFYERGAGETRSSGTGSCASALAAIYGRMCTSPVTILAPGGAQTVRAEDQVYLRGEARLICSGEFSISGE